MQLYTAEDFARDCRGLIMGKQFFELLDKCNEHQNMLKNLSPELKADIAKTAHWRSEIGIGPTNDALKALLYWDDWSEDKKAQYKSAVFKNNDFFLQQVLIFHGENIESAAKMHYTRDTRESELLAKAAYDKLEQYTGINAKTASSNNIRILQEQLGDLTAEEAAFVKQVQRMFSDGHVALWHESGRGTGGNLHARERIKSSGALFSRDELHRRKLSFPGQTYGTDVDVIGNTDFVFFNSFFEYPRNSYQEDCKSYYGMVFPLVALPEHCMFHFGDWLHFTKESAASNDIEKKTTFDSEGARKTLFYYTDIPQGIALNAVARMRQLKQGEEIKYADRNWEYGKNDLEILNCFSEGEFMIPNNFRVNLISNGRRDPGGDFDMNQKTFAKSHLAKIMKRPNSETQI